MLTRSLPSTSLETRAERWIATEEKGRFRRARKTRRCQHYWDTACQGNGQIEAGQPYFDLQELDGYAGGFSTFCCCSACSNKAAA